MNDVAQLHPDDLIDRYHAGELDDDGQTRLDAHLEGCEACRLELVLAQDLDDEEEEAPPALDHLVLGAVPSRPRLPGARWLWVLAALAIGGTAAAAYLGARAGGTTAAPTAPEPVAGTVGPAAVAASPAPQEPDEPAADGPAADGPGADGPAKDGLSVAPSSTTTATLAVEATAASLFAAGNKARRGGDSARALALYQELQRRHPESREARLSRAMSAKLLAEDDPDAAVSAYDEYLDEGGRLSEEALVGRAEALAKLGREQEEAATWQQLLAQHPKSLHAARARKRLAQLQAKPAE